MVTFRRIEAKELPPLAIQFLQEAINRTPGSTARLDLTLDMAAKGFGDLYLIEDGELIGCMYILTYTAKARKVVCPVLIGGRNMRKWHAEAEEFVIAGAKRINALIRAVGRRGWRKRFPQSKVIGYIYEYDPEGV